MVLNMEEEETIDKKRMIIDKLVLKEKDILEKLQKLVELAEPFINFIENDWTILLASKYDFSYKEKISLIAISMYFIHQYGISDNYKFNMQVIREKLGGVERTTLSGPLGNLVDEGILNKPEKDNYSINIFRIESTLIEFRKKYKIE